MPTLFLLNPGAGKPKDLDSLTERIEAVYQLAGRRCQIEHIDFARLDETLLKARQEGIRRVFAVGGDGTVNAIGSRLIGTDVHFGVIPMGSGNGFARNLGFSIKPSLAIRQSLDAKTLLADTGSFGGHPFLNVAGVGLDAEISRTFAMAGRRGFRPYVSSTIQALLHLRPQTYHLTIDNETTTFPDSFGVVVANGAQWGYEAKVTRNSSIADGKLDIMVIRKFSVFKAGVMVSRMFNGTLASDPDVTFLRSSHLVLERDHAGSLQIDGEALEGGTSLEAFLRPQSLHLLLPNTLTRDRINRL